MTLTVNLLRKWKSARGLALLALLLAPGLLAARKFYPDDPLQAVPPPRPVQTALNRQLSEYFDFFHNTFVQPGERHSKTKIIPAQEVNTLGEVPDGAWYTNRHYQRRMSIAELVRGPGNENAPATDGPLKVIAAKTEGVTPGFTIEDARGRRFVVKFDPLTNPEMASAADVISSKFFYALGYHVPENYIVHRTLLGNGIIQVEHMANLGQIPTPRCQFIAFPLKLVGVEGSPCRAVAIVD